MAETKTKPGAAQRRSESRNGPPSLKHGKQWSRTAQRAKWTNSAEDHEDRKGQTLATRDHDVIRQWAEQRKAVPAGVKGSVHGERRGVLRFIFETEEGGGSDRLEKIPWDEWFHTFDDRELAFLYQEHRKDGSESNFFRLDSPHREDG